MNEDIIKMMTEIYKLMASDDFADSIAQMLWNIKEKLVEKGFSHEEALAITMTFAKNQMQNK